MRIRIRIPYPYTNFDIDSYPLRLRKSISTINPYLLFLRTWIFNLTRTNYFYAHEFSILTRTRTLKNPYIKYRTRTPYYLFDDITTCQKYFIYRLFHTKSPPTPLLSPPFLWNSKRSFFAKKWNSFKYCLCAPSPPSPFLKQIFAQKMEGAGA